MVRRQEARYTGNHFNEADDRHHDGDRRGRREHIGVIADIVFAESVNETVDGAKELSFKVFLSRENTEVSGAAARQAASLGALGGTFLMSSLASASFHA